jgi:single-stranded-DNA-specific exonuclease
VETFKEWHIAPCAPGAFMSQLDEQGVHPVVAQIFHNRGQRTPEALQAFLGYESPANDPFQMQGMSAAVARIREAIRAGERIVVYGDFDADGVSATGLLTLALRQMGAEATPYIPDRVDEGYGLNADTLRRLAASGARLVVTVDCGIRSVGEVIAGQESGLDIIISDHHSVGPVLPPALAVVNPKQDGCRYPEKDLAGVGVAYKIAQALFLAERKVPIGKGSPDWQVDELLDLVALGTVADVVPLVGENRALVREGLARLNAGGRIGVQMLCQVAQVQQVTAMHVGFVLGPRLNAAGRLGDAMLACNLLLADNADDAAELAIKLNTLNRERQEWTHRMRTWAEESLGDSVDKEPLIFSADERYLQGVVGLVAGRLTEEHYRPSVVVAVGETLSHGSCRSIPEFHITRALDACADLLVRHGGHAAAAGFTARTENLPALAERLHALAAERLDAQKLVPSLDIDATLELGQIEAALMDALDGLEPTGYGNPSPLFVAHGVRVLESRAVGAEGTHLKLTLSDGVAVWDGIAFRQGRLIGHLPDRLDIVYHLETHEWGGQRRLQLNIQDFRAA